MGPNQSSSTIFTIGHSTHPIETFIGLLSCFYVTAIADVRSSPYSRYQPQFNREVLQSDLKQHGIAYVFMGKELGGRSEDRSCYDDRGQVQYRVIAQTEAFRAGIERIRSGSASHRIALMCAEREPLDCHRALLISRELVALGTNVVHILGDGLFEPHEDSITRLRQVLKIPETDLFWSQEELIDEAYAIQSRRVAYVDERLAVQTGTDRP